MPKTDEALQQQFMQQLLARQRGTSGQSQRVDGGYSAISDDAMDREQAERERREAQQRAQQRSLPAHPGSQRGQGGHGGPGGQGGAHGGQTLGRLVEAEGAYDAIPESAFAANAREAGGIYGAAPPPAAHVDDQAYGSVPAPAPHEDDHFYGPGPSEAQIEARLNASSGIYGPSPVSTGAIPENNNSAYDALPSGTQMEQRLHQLQQQPHQQQQQQQQQQQ
eukprot:CAMPEP_0168593188 /NCGR_PEP_ID=MMETSP0420-20121227/8163_1 /TAXON_ID=498008 /ORGANISM="Pessonella sp." /LENGTH=220 /DNA_ID=CAMNT_0008629287 /DNA_START=251 /DNA_END=910 /DNA_ORIENTATION=+